MLDPESVRLLALITLGGVGGLIIEWLMLRGGFGPYFRVGVALNVSPLPLDVMPEGGGQTSSVSWQVFEQGLVRFWAEQRLAGSVWGLHGLVHLRRHAGRYHVDIRWFPPWTPFLCLVALIVRGGFTGTIHVLGPVCFGFALMLVAVYHRAAVRAAAELRWAFVRSEDPI